jgi:CBS domain containing-hemolysin-like protein
VNPWVALLLSVVLLAANAAFVAVEFALVGARPSRLASLAEGGSRRAGLALGFLRRLDYQLAGSQLGITLASLSLGYVAEPLVVHTLENLFGLTPIPEVASAVVAFALGLGAVVFVHMVVGEMVPKNVAITAPEPTLLAWLLNAVAALVVRRVGIVPRQALAVDMGREGLVAMLEESRRHGAIERGAQRLLAGVLEFGGGTVGSVMVPWAQVSAVTTETTVADAEDAVAASGHSRLPVVDPDGAAVGFVHAKDLLALSSAAADLRLPLRLVRRVAVVPPTQPLDDLLLRMRSTGVHLALVAAEERLVGLVTLEDLLGELLGDLGDD